MSGWRFLVDRGGTFTDVVAVAPDGALHARKLPARDGGLAQALREIADDGLDASAALHLGTTVATNALLERRGARVAMAVTRGFRDLLEIGTQQRPRLFSLRIEKPPPLPELVIEIDERVLADGTVRRAPDVGAMREAFERARAAGCDALAVAFAHAALHPAHERLAAEAARDLGFACVVLSSECDPAPGLLARAQTAAADAYLTPPLSASVDAIAREVPGRSLFMTSSGGLVPARAFRGKDAVLSGPAGGAVALGHVAREAGCEQALGLDMGGTSTDVSRWSLEDGVERAREREVAGITLRAPMADVLTIAAGGGSILGRVGGRLVVGPRSAGSSPGPAAYGRGGPATVTDAHVVLGRVRPERFPRCFGRDGAQPLDVSAARAALSALGEPFGLSPEQAALGALRVADEAMARALREVSVARGRDPRDHALVAFGGAAPQHACSLASVLGMTRVLVHPLAGALSALGLGLTSVTATRHAPLIVPLDATGLERARRVAVELGDAAREAVEGDAPSAPRVELSVRVRHPGTESGLDVPMAGELGDVIDAFRRAHRRTFGFSRDELPCEIASVSATATAPLPALPQARIAKADGPPRPAESVTVTFADGARDIPLHERESLRWGHVIAGPALIADPLSTIVVEPGWRALVRADGTLDMEPLGAPASREPLSSPVRLAVMGSRFMGIAEQMGQALRRTAQSPNMRERLDFSCALFTRDGRLVANAPHVPVHLGAMGETVRSILAARGERGFEPGMAIASNDPRHGGSHLPDVTVVSPVFADGALRFFVANRGHHADVGGVVPGSMPPFATTLAEEGIVMHDVALCRDGRWLDDAERLLRGGEHPARGVPERLADLRAQVAANAMGARLLAELAGEWGAEAVEQGMRDVVDDAARACAEMLSGLPDGERRFADVMDDGERVEVAIAVASGRARFDFTGTSAQSLSSLNAPRAVVRACVLYALRCLLGRDVPLNEGVLEPVEIVVPEGSLLSPGPGAAVCGGNVETSMRIADVVLAALGAQAASQGTMNNLTFGNDAFAQYETIGGGSGAGPGFDGASAVHSHMTNTRLTDVEALEMRAPVVVREVSVRRGTGGEGAHRGGDGMVRAIEALVPMTVAILSERRRTLPFGLVGGEPGAPGVNRVLRAGGTAETLGGKCEVEAGPGDVIIVATPGGGGFGPARNPS